MWALQSRPGQAGRRSPLAFFPAPRTGAPAGGSTEGRGARKAGAPESLEKVRGRGTAGGSTEVGEAVREDGKRDRAGRDGTRGGDGVRNGGGNLGE